MHKNFVGVCNIIYVCDVALIERYREEMCKRQKRHSPYADGVFGDVNVVRRVVRHERLLDVRRAEGIIVDGHRRCTEIKRDTVILQ
jgi:hypothetical protein